MPYKDLEQRRRYDREYKQRLRAQQGLTRRGQTPGRKAYICLRVPHLRLGAIVFQDGWFISDNPEEHAILEQHPDYGRHIFSWRVEP